jgi:hypothetical protein
MKSIFFAPLNFFKQIKIMKKLFLILSVVTAFAITSCDNDNSVNPQPLGKAVVTGTVFADFDFTNNASGTTYDKVANKKVIAAIYDNYNESVRYVETTTDGNGNYTLEVEIGNRELDVYIHLVDFKADVRYADGIKNEIFYGEGFSTNLDIEKGGEYIRDIYYND